MIILAMLAGAAILLVGIVVGGSMMLAIHNAQNQEED